MPDKEPQKRLPKYRRDPEHLPKREITARSLEIIAAVERYKFLPSSLIVKLVSGHPKHIHRHLHALYHNGFVNRFAFPRVGNPGQFIYYLDDARSLALIVNAGANRDELDYEGVKRNREKRYDEINFGMNIDDIQGRLMHLQHEVMISRFHFMLEMACRSSKGTVELQDFQQGAKLWHTVEAPKYSVDASGNMRELDQTERLPHRPDAFFTLHFPKQPEGSRYARFFYEADRRHTSTKKHNRKLRAHFHYIVKQRKYVEDYGIKRVRAVLIETTDMYWADSLRQAAKSPVVSGSKITPLFWFTTSQLFTKQNDSTEQPTKEPPLYLDRPEIVFSKVWASPAGNEFYSLLD